jgi:BA14K-like protein
MLYKYTTLILGAMLGISTLAFSGASASAAAMLPLSPVASGEVNGVNDGIVQVKNVNDYGNNYGSGSWNKKHFNNNCYYKNGGCYNKHRNKHRRDRFDRSYLFLPLIIGGGYGAYNYYDYNDGYDDYYDYAGVSSKHVRWCLNRYRSYNPRTNLWTAYSGRKHQCDSPYY